MQTKFKELSDSQWSIIKKILPRKTKGKYKLRDIVNGILYILRTGVQWRNLPDSYPKYGSVFYHFRKWKRNGTLRGLNDQLNILERNRQGKKDSPSMLSIDSQSVKIGPFIYEEKGLDGNKKVNGRKRHIITDTLGLLWNIVVHPANEHDGTTGHRVIEPIIGYVSELEKILADAAYKKGFQKWVENNMLGVEVELSSKPPTSKGFVPVKWRWVTEQTFGRFNFFRRLSKDYEKTVESSEAWVFWHNCQTILIRLDK